VRMGGGQKSVSEWAEGILRWLENQRPGRDRGKPFDYGQMLAQHFPGSNIDAWLSVNGVSPQMKEVFWTYAEGKAKGVGTTQGQFEVAAPGGSLAWERLRSQTEYTKTEFRLSSMMTGQYATRESSNRWLNSLMGTILNNIIPRITGPGSPLNIIQFLPDMVEDFLFQMLESSGPYGHLLGGGLFDIGALIGGVSNVGMNTGAPGMGDIGDVGDYGILGGSTTAGLHPDLRKRVDAMMQANPRVRVTSGLRDRATQMRLHRKGVGRVSPGPSAHTRGMAADLGPRSEYGWIMANAPRFRLKSGASYGEPWHVGMGDTPDIGQLPEIPVISDAFGAGLDVLEGLDPTGLVGAARSADDVIGLLFDLFKGFIDGIKKMGELMSGGIFSIKDLIESAKGGMTPQAFLGKNIPDFLNILLGPFQQFATTGGAAPAPSRFDAGFAAGLPRNITLGGESRGFFSAPGAGSGGSKVGGFVGESIVAGGTGGTPEQNKQLGKAMAAAVGWTGGEWSALLELWQNESGWRTNADNPSSSAYGIPQALPGSKMGSHGPDWRTNPRTQIAWGIDYIKSRPDYGTPSRALSKWRSRSPHWYAGGAWSTDAGYAHHEQDEMVLPATIAEHVRLALNNGLGGNTAQMVFNNTFQIGTGSGGGGLGGGSVIDMRRTAATLADYLEQEMRQRQARNN
jgi:hypothetical protein